MQFVADPDVDSAASLDPKDEAENLSLGKLVESIHFLAETIPLASQ